MGFGMQPTSLVSSRQRFGAPSELAPEAWAGTIRARTTFTVWISWLVDFVGSFVFDWICVMSWLAPRFHTQRVMAGGSVKRRIPSDS